MRFESSLARSAQVITVLAAVLLLLTSVLVLFRFERAPRAAHFWLGLGAAGSPVLLLYLFLAAPQAVEVEGQELKVVRRIGARSFSLARLRASQEIGSAEMKGAVRLFGVGGFLGWWGSFRSHALGNFRLYATRLDHLVLLQFDDGKVVVSVNDPGALLRELRRAI